MTEHHPEAADVAERPVLRLGLIGVDSPHAPQFTRLLGDGVTGTVTGARVDSAWRGSAAEDFPLSYERIDNFASEVSSLGVTLCHDPEEVAARSDALLIVASDARTHPEYFARVAPFGKPVYVDTRFALTAADGVDMLELARRHRCLALADSPKRFVPEVRAANAGRVERIDLAAPLPTQPGHPVLSWYGFHPVDIAVAALGPGCTGVDASTPGAAIVLTWADGRVATITGDDQWSPITSGRVLAADGEREFSIEAGPHMLPGLLDAIVEACHTGVHTVPEDQVIDVVRIVEAATRSRRSGTAEAISA